MLDKLGNVLKKTTDKIANAIFLDKNLIASIVRDLQRALIEADVNILLVKKLTDEIKKGAFDERIKDIDKKEHVIKLLHDELIKIIGKEKPLVLQKKNKIMLLGLYGAGKTTTISKLGNYYQKRGKKVAIIGLDVHRPAAKEQLKQLGEKNNLKVFVDIKEDNAINTWKKFKKDLEEFEVILIDTAGRHDLDKELVKEITDLGKEIKPTETILTLPADIGQAAKKQAEEFQKNLGITGVIITRMDSTAKGGGALTACSETNAPIYFITNGEKIRSVTDEGKTLEMQERLSEGKITLDDVIEQVKSMNQMGGFEKLKGMIPGMNTAKIPEGKMEKEQEKIAKWEHIIKSMTKEEKENPELLEKQTTRIGRVAKGAGVNNSDVRSLLKQRNGKRIHII
jgi:signal recognition particle subunit SRP54